jgi:ribA/ribD-fused uncharacterized protein
MTINHRVPDAWECETETGVYFWGGILTNWAKFSFVADTAGEKAVRFNTAEQYMMRVKAELFDDPLTLMLIMNTSNPKEQKRLGRQIVGYSDEVWDPVARDLTYPGVYAKFAQNEGIRDLLLSTENKIIVEASPLDRKWGVGLSHNDPLVFNKATWQGKNWLGHVVMKARDDLRAGVVPELLTAIDWTIYE